MSDRDAVLRRHAVTVLEGEDPRPVVFVHGFGCHQGVWRRVVGPLEGRRRIVLLDLVGAGGSDTSAYDPVRHASLDGYAQDLVEVLDACAPRGATLVGHSVGGTIALLAAARRPELFESLLLVAPSPCYANDGDYVGGFEREDLEDLLDAMDANYRMWARSLAPVIMSNPARRDLSDELAANFCEYDETIARSFARATFLSDHRHVLPEVRVPTVVFQCTHDAVAPGTVGAFLHARLPRSELVQLQATGHCPHVSGAPELVAHLERRLGLTATAHS